MAPTPMVYFAAYHLRTGCCVVGHRQPQPAGLQRLQDRGRRRTLSGDEITDLYARIAEDRLHAAPAPGSAGAARRSSTTTSQRIAADVQLDAPAEDRGRLPATASPASSAPRVLRGDRLRSRCRCTARSTATSRTTIPTRASRRTCADLIQTVQRAGRRARPRLRRRRRPPRRGHHATARSSIPTAS